MIKGLSSVSSAPFVPNHVHWFVEPSLSGSPTYALQRKILYALDRALESRFNFVESWPVSVIVARSQAFIARTLQDLGCVPNLARTNGVVLMGASVCDRHVIISNITGFLFLVRADQVITPALERRREPPLARVPYRIVMRNSSALAHEYTHIWRAAGLKGLVRPDEPAWFSEGFAEFWSGVGKVLAFRGRVPYETHHVVRLRDFVDWPAMCPLRLSAYRTVTPLANGCEYHVGEIAVEYLYAKYSSLEKTLNAFARAEDYETFEDGFKGTFGITLAQFEKEADAYIDGIRRAEVFSRSAKLPR